MSLVCKSTLTKVAFAVVLSLIVIFFIRNITFSNDPCSTLANEKILIGTVHDPMERWAHIHLGSAARHGKIVYLAEGFESGGDRLIHYFGDVPNIYGLRRGRAKRHCSGNSYHQ